MDIGLTPHFRRQFRKLAKGLQEEAYEKIERFADLGQHDALRVHKLKGRLADRWSFSVNYRFRIIFKWEKLNESAILLAIGDHSIYD